MHTSLPPEDPILAWNAAGHLHHERSRAWYVCAGIVVLGCAIYSLYSHAWTFTILIVLTSAVYWKTHTIPPTEKSMRIWKRGFAINDAFMEWKDCTGYWVTKGKTFTRLTIERRRGGEESILTGNVSAFTLHEVLPELLPELIERKEKTIDKIIRICKI